MYKKNSLYQKNWKKYEDLVKEFLKFKNQVVIFVIIIVELYVFDKYEEVWFQIIYFMI